VGIPNQINKIKYEIKCKTSTYLFCIEYYILWTRMG